MQDPVHKLFVPNTHRHKTGLAKSFYKQLTQNHNSLWARSHQTECQLLGRTLVTRYPEQSNSWSNLLKSSVVVLLLVVAAFGDGGQKVSMKHGIILDKFTDLGEPEF